MVHSAAETLSGIALDAVALVAVYAASAKLRDMQAFRHSLTFLPFLAAPFIPWISALVASLELAVGVGLLLRMPYFYAVAAGTFAVFAGVSFYVSKRTLYVPCACFGDVGEAKISFRSAAVGAILAATVVVAATTESAPASVLSVTLAGTFAVVVLLVTAARRNVLRSWELRNGAMAGG